MSTPSPIAAAAMDLHAAYPGLLSPVEPACGEEQREAAQRFDAARERLQGRREAAAQLSLDIGHAAPRVSL